METARSGTRLALFLPTLDDGGAERVMLQLAEAFPARGHPVDLVLAIPGGPLDSQIPAGPRVVSLGASRTVSSLPALVRYLRRERPIALLSTLEHSNVLAVWAAAIARTGTPVVLREASVLLPETKMQGARSRILYALMRHAYRRASAVIAVSSSVATSLISGLDLDPARVHTVFNPVVSGELHRRSAAPLDDPWFAAGAPPVILGVGRLSPEKDYATLLRAFAQVRAEREARLVILGEGPERGALEELVRQLGIAPDVKLPGFDHNPFRYMSRATVFALSSRYEGLPGALIQAMACGCRVLSTDCPGGSREVLQDGALGPLVPPGDPTAMGRALAALLDDAAQGPARVEHPVERFTDEATIGAYLQILQPRGGSQAA